MKTFLAGILILSQSAFASFYEVECDYKKDQLEVEVLIEDFPRGSYFKQAEFSIIKDGKENVYRDSVNARAVRGFNEIVYSGSNMRLEINTWPDNTPRWGRSYRARFSSIKLENNRKTINLECRFPNSRF